MAQLWVPDGQGGGQQPPSVEEFLKRVLAQIQQFAIDCRCERVQVEVVLHDGRRLHLHSITPEPGFGWVTLRPFADAEADEEADDESEAPPPEQLIVPLQSIIRFIVGPVEEEHRFGFVPPELPADPADES